MRNLYAVNKVSRFDRDFRAYLDRLKLRISRQEIEKA